MINRKSHCRCLLCAMERRLTDQFAGAAGHNAFCRFAQFSTVLSAFPAASDLVSYLHTEKSNGNGTLSKDGVLRELLLGAMTNGNPARELLLLVFVPMLHRLSRQIMTRYPALPSDDITQDLIVALLKSLGSGAFRDRNSHIAFAIARHLRRIAFVRAERESRSWLQARNGVEALEPWVKTSGAQPIESSVFLRHFLDRCRRHGVLSGEDVQLIVQFKLNDTWGVGSSNASRQRMKRLIGKLRRAARQQQTKTNDRQLRLF